MNFFEFHIGDYDQATAHLSACEDGIYSRLIRWYMASEAPLPGDVAAIQRKVRARSKDERAAVLVVLEEFFVLAPDGCYHNVRCDQEIARYVQAEPERAAARDRKREAEVTRKRRSRERRAAMFDALRDKGVVPPFDTSMSQLSALCRQHGVTVVVTPDVTQDVTRDMSRGHAEVTTLGTGTHFPLPSNSIAERSATSTGVGSGPPGFARSAAGQVGEAAVAAGMRREDVHLEDPMLAELLKAGADLDQFRAAAEAAVAAGVAHPWPWMLRRVQGRLADAAGAAQALAVPWHETRSGIEAKGEELGLGRWDEAAAAAGTGPYWPAYQARVYRAAGYTPQEVGRA